MGQYYKPVNLDKKQHLNALDYGHGLKLMGHSYIENPFVAAVENLLTPSGAWYKNRIVWAGDYADAELRTSDDKHPEGRNICSIIGDDDHTRICPTETRLDKKFHYLVNHTLKVFVDRSAVNTKDNRGYIINPLPLFTCEGNGRGGGDFQSEDDRIGSWARHVLSLEATEPDGYEKVDGNFEERPSKLSSAPWSCGISFTLHVDSASGEKKT